MKKYILLALFISYWQLGFSQSTSKQVLGSYIHKKVVYNYDFKKEEEDNYSLFITQLEGNIKGKQSASKSDSSTQGKVGLDMKNVTPKDTLTEGADSTKEESTESKEGIEYFSELSKDVFDRTFKEQMIAKFNVDDDTMLQEKSSEIFFKIKARLEFIDDEPTTAYFILKKDNIVSFLKENQAEYYQSSLSRLILRHDVYETKVETDNGTIKSIKVKLIDYKSIKNQSTSPRKFLDFKNQYPISISGKFDPDKLANIFLYCTNCGGIKGLTRFIKLSDLLVYDILLENEKEDYSPANKVISLTPGHPIVEVRKEKRSKILEVAAYTDFVGLNQNEPNGLIQFEAKRKIIINSTHRNWRQKRYKSSDKDITMEEYAQRFDMAQLRLGSKDIGESSYLGKTTVPKDINKYFEEPQKPAVPHDSNAQKSKVDTTTAGKSAADSVSKSQKTKTDGNPSSLLTLTNQRFYPINYVWFNNIEFKLQFLKLDQNNRFLPQNAQTLVEGNIVIHPIDLYRFQLTKFGTTLELYRLNFVQQKFSWNVLNFGINWFTVRVEDGTSSAPPTDPVATTSLSNISMQPGTSVTWRPDSRYGVTLGTTYVHQSVWNSKYSLENNDGLLQYHVDAHLQTAENSRLFFRFRLSHEIKHRYQNFTQIQLGYNVDIFSTRNSSAKSK